MYQGHRRLSRVKARLLTRSKKFDLAVIAGLLVMLAFTMLLVPRAEAQLTFPRLGLSASPTSYVDSLAVEIGQEFTLYVCAFGNQPGDPLEQDISVLQWAVHQVCCGAVLQIIDTEFSPDFYHEGTPYFGVSSSSETCVSEEAIVLATLTIVLDAPEPGDYLAAAGPWAAAVDCDGNNPLFMDMPMTLTATSDGISPVSQTTWGGLKATYR